MPIDNTKYVYINRVGLEKGSKTLEKFEKDARDHFLVGQPGKLAAMRLVDYYNLLERFEALVGGSPSMQPPASTGTIEDQDEEEEETGLDPQGDSSEEDLLAADELNMWG